MLAMSPTAIDQCIAPPRNRNVFPGLYRWCSLYIFQVSGYSIYLGDAKHEFLFVDFRVAPTPPISLSIDLVQLTWGIATPRIMGFPHDMDCRDDILRVRQILGTGYDSQGKKIDASGIMGGRYFTQTCSNLQPIKNGSVPPLNSTNIPVEWT